MLNTSNLPSISSKSPTKMDKKDNKDPYYIDPVKFQKFIQMQLQMMPQLHNSNPKELAQQLAIKYMKIKDNTPMTRSSIISGDEKQKKISQESNGRQILHLPVIIQNQYSYYLGNGNNYKVVQRVIDGRNEWNQCGNHLDLNINLKWQQSHKGFQYDRITMNGKIKVIVNHFEFHHEISQKNNLFDNLRNFCQNNGIDIFDIVPITFILDFQSEKSDLMLLNFLNYYELNDQIKQKGKQVPSEQQKKFFMIRRMLGTFQHQTEAPQILQNKISETFIGQDYLWMLKPTQLNRGRGIHVIKDLDTFSGFVDQYINGKLQLKDGSTIKSKAFVIQKYMEKPLLIHNRKFDIRVWVLLNQDLECFFFEQGYIRLASEEYNCKNVNNQYIHLTNNAIQKFNPKYGKIEDGNQMSFDQVQLYFAHKGDFQKNIVERIKKISFMAFCSVKQKINPYNRKICFEIFGLDFMIDENFKSWLIEVNTNPCLEESSTLLKMLIPRMLDDAFALTIDTVFPLERRKRYSVTNYPDNQNLWVRLGRLQDKL